MADFKVFKEASVPTAWYANAVYYVKIGSVVTTYVTDNVGTPYFAGTSSETDPVYTASISKQVMYKGIIPAGDNLNNYQTTGVYIQNSNANAGAGVSYPEAYAGMLEVQSDVAAGFIFQRYTTYQQVGTTVYKRSYYAGTWSAWVKLMSSSEGVVWGENVAGNMYNGYTGNSVLNNGSSTGTPDGGSGFSWNAALSNTGGIYSAQMYIGYSAGPGASLDNFFYRANQQGGPGWPTPWFRVASREWANANLIQNQSSVTQTANFIISGTGRMAKLGIGVAPPVNYLTRFGGNVTGGGNNYGGVAYVNPTVQSDITTAFYGIVSNIATQATSFTLSNALHFVADAATVGAGSTIAIQTGFRASSTMTQAGVNYGFRGEIPASGLNNWNLYNSGTAPNYMNGSLGIGNTALSTTNLRITKPVTGGVGAYNVLSDSTIQSDVTALAAMYQSNPSTQAATFTLAELMHYNAQQNTFGAGSTVAVQSGFRAHSTMVGATTNYGFYGLIPAGTGRWNLYMSGTADNYLAGRLGVGSNSLTTANLKVSKTLTGGFAAQGVQQDGSVQSDATVAYGYDNISNTQAAAFTVSDYVHFQARQGAIGSGSAITRQAAFQVSSNMSGATNNYGFSGQLQFGAGRWNLYMSGAADNYINGNVGIGTNAPASALHLAGGRYLRLSSIVANKLLKTNADSDVVAAVPGVDYVASESDPIYMSDRSTIMLYRLDINFLEDMNSLEYTQTGWYTCENDGIAASAVNMPVPYAGIMTVINAGTILIQQTYQATNNRGYFQRMFNTFTGVWSAWVELATDAIKNQTATTQAAGFKINGTGESTTTLAAPTVKTNMIVPYSGSGTTFGGDLILTTVASKLLKVDVTGKVVPAVANVDYVEYVGETVLFVSATQTLSVNDCFPTANTTACVVYCDASAGNVVITLPGVIDIAGKGAIHFIKTDNSGNKVVVKGVGSTLINDTNAKELLTRYQKMTVRGGDAGQYWLF